MAKSKQKMFIVLGLIVFVVLLVVAARFLSGREYDYLVFEGDYYAVTNEPMEQDELGAQVGEVLNQAPKKIFGGNADFDSNCLPVGTEIYTFSDNGTYPYKRLIVARGDRFCVAYEVVENVTGESIVYRDASSSE